MAYANLINILKSTTYHFTKTEHCMFIFWGQGKNIVKLKCRKGMGSDVINHNSAVVIQMRVNFIKILVNKMHTSFLI